MKANTVNIKDMANFIILYFKKNGIMINPLKLQKLLYYIQGWHLVYFDKNPMFPEQPEAWVNGPVYRNVYDVFSGRYRTYDNIAGAGADDDIDNKLKASTKKLNLEPEQAEFVDAIFKRYGKISHEKLVFMTHSEKPWLEARKGLGPFDYSTRTITHDSMYDYFNKLKNK